MEKKEINTGWKKITLREYIEYTELYFREKDNSDLSLILMAKLTKKSLTDIKSMPIPLLTEKFEKNKYINDDIYAYGLMSPILDLGDQQYFIRKDFGNLSFNQWQNLDELLKQSEDNYLKNIHLLLGIVVQDKDYEYDKAIEIGKILLDRPMYYLIENICFFFSNDENLSNASVMSLMRKTEAEMISNLEVTLNNSITSIKYGGGMSRFKRWLTTILLKLVRFWVTRYKIS